jgi:DNA end-binding protein Ku
VVARSIWSGSISFGLVTIPVKAYSAIREHDVHFHLLGPDGARVENRRVSKKSGRALEYKQLKKGYETTKGKYVVFDQDELKELAPRSTKTIDIEDFVPLEDIDPVYFARTYHLAPANEAAAHAYGLLTSVMEDRQRIGVGKVVMREKQYLAAIRPYGKGLAMSTMLFADEVVPQTQITDVPTRRPKVDQRERKLAEQILDALESPWKPDRYHDDYEEELRRRIKAKQQGKLEAVDEEAEAPAKVLDLMEALQASLDRGASRGKRASSAAKKSTTRKRTSAKPKSRAAASPRKRTQRTARHAS